MTHKSPLSNKGQLLRDTTAVCHHCFERVPAQVVIHTKQVSLEKHCKVHGKISETLSHNPHYWGELDSFYFRVNPAKYPQRDYIVRMTENCNLNCPICLAKANTEQTSDLDLTGLERLIGERRGIKIDLMAAEPTLREDLEEWIQRVKASGNIAALHTNGLKLAKRAYAERIKAAGIDEVFLQFDGFDDEAHKVLRGRPLVQARMAALKNLRELNIATSLIVVIAKDLNETAVRETFEFAAQAHNHHIREVFFMGLRLLGSARDAMDRDGESSFEDARLMPDDLISMLTDQVSSIDREHILNFNKLYFTLLSIFKVKKCLYIQHYLMLRRRDGTIQGIHQVVDLDKVGRAADRYAVTHRSKPLLAKASFMLRLSTLFANPRAARFGLDLIRLQQLFRAGMNLKSVPDNLLLLGFITACDPHNFDAAVSINCGKGELSVDGGFVESSAVANVDREARFTKSQRKPGSRKKSKKAPSRPREQNI